MKPNRTREEVVEEWLKRAYGWHKYHSKIESIDVDHFANKMLRELGAAKPAKKGER